MIQGSFNRLSIIFENENQLIIPDLQRDYCWGHIKPKNQENTLAYNFCNELLDTSKKLIETNNLEISYGIIYTYEYPETFFYLCDGQQRLTTLYLIIGVLNSFLESDSLKKILVLDNKQPRLKYEVRTTTDYFISSCIKNIFLSKETIDINKIQNTNWFRKDFEDDPSIKSMIDALKSIYLIVNKDNAPILERFLLNAIGFVCVNLNENESLESGTFSKIREYGEKMYEIVNTSGDPMEPNEHTKVILLSSVAENEKQKWTEKWEIWQDFFWNKRLTEHETGDEGFNEFLSWIEALKGKGGKVERVDEIEEYFKAIYFWCEINPMLLQYSNVKIFNILDNFHAKNPSKLVVILPTLVYLKNSDLVSFKETGYELNKEYLNIELLFRFIRFFTNISKNSEAGGIASSLAKELNPNDDILKVLNFKKQYKSILTDEEIYKLEVLKHSDCSIRREIEKIFWEAEDHDFLNGKINPIFNWISRENKNTNIESFAIESFKSIYSVFLSLFDETKIELVKLFLLALTRDWGVFQEGWSWGSSRYYLGLKDSKFWREKITYAVFADIVINEKRGSLNDNYLKESTKNLEHVWQRNVISKLKSEGLNHWQWRDNNRFFVYENALYFPNGVQAKSYTAKIEL